MAIYIKMEIEGGAYCQIKVDYNYSLWSTLMDLCQTKLSLRNTYIDGDIKYTSRSTEEMLDKWKAKEKKKSFA